MATKRIGERRAVRYRIVAAEAHSWSSLLLEDERGQHYLYVLGAKAPTKLAASAAGELLAKRAYRPWRGDRSWSPLDQLPIAHHAVEPAGGVGLTTVVSSGLGQEETQPV